jgi:hypothetical protein
MSQPSIVQANARPDEGIDLSLPAISATTPARFVAAEEQDVAELIHAPY